MLQIQPDEEIVLEFIKNKDYKYLRALGAFYFRLTGQAKDIYRVLEPVYADYRRLVIRKGDTGKFETLHMDELIDNLLRDETFCDVTLPRISKRHVLEEEGVLEPYESALNIQDEDMQGEESGSPEEPEFQKNEHEEVKDKKFRSPSSSSNSSSSSDDRRRR